MIILQEISQKIGLSEISVYVLIYDEVRAPQLKSQNQTILRYLLERSLELSRARSQKLLNSFSKFPEGIFQKEFSSK